MFTPKPGSSLLAGRRPGSRSNTPLSGSKRPSHHLLNASSRAGQGTTPVTRTNTIENTGSHILATLGGSLPVLVTEVLTMVSAGEVSVTLCSNGWAWLVSGRRLVVWRYTGSGRTQSRELSLPPSDLKHRSDLCAVYCMTPGQTPCCVAVSPEGVIRYWTSIVHEGSSSDISAELGGQECMSLVQLESSGCVLATTSGTLVLLYHTNQGISCKHLQPSHNLLGGIGRRVSSLLWGSISGAQGSEAKLIRVVCQKSICMVLTSASLQKWIIEDADSARQIYEADLNDLIKENMWNVLSAQGVEGKPSWLKVWCLDMCLLLGEDKIVLLVAGINTNESLSQAEATKFKVYYGLVVLRVRSDVPPFDADTFKLLPESAIISEGEEPRAFRISAVKDYVYVMSEEDIHPVSLSEDSECPKLSVGPGNSIIGIGKTPDSTLLFTPSHGVLSLSAAQKENRMDLTATPDSSFLDKSLKLSDTLNISVSAQGLENLTMSESKGDQLKAAFLLYCKRCIGQAQAMTEELFPASLQPEPVDSALDRLVLSLSKDLIDDFPASDPRWMESLPASQVAGTGSTMSLLVLHQLEDKLTCHQLFLAFLKNVGLWSRLSAVSSKSGTAPVSTVLSLAEHNEKIVAAITLRTIHNDFSRMVDSCIKISLDDRDITAAANLTAQDHFYREISRIDELIESAVLNLQHCVRVERQNDLVDSITSINTVVISILRAVLAHRNKNLEEFCPTGSAVKLESVPWSTAKRSQLINLFNLTVAHVVKSSEEDTDRMKMNAQLMDLADIVLDGFRSEVESVEGEDRKHEASQHFTRTKEQLIGNLVDLKLYDQATSLGEKYLDFNSLVRVCEETGSEHKLGEYIAKYNNFNFSDNVFSWYMKQGKQSRLLSVSSERSKELSRFLSGHNDLSWLHDIHTGKMANASGTLIQIAANETDIFERKKLQLSLAKLTALAAEEEDKESLLQQLDADFVLQSAQESIPSRVLEGFGIEKNSMRVLTPREMIEMYIGEENVDADCLDFIKALNLLDYLQLEQEEVEKVRLHVWCQSILRDAWKDIDVNNPINSVQETVFFKVIEYGYHQGYDLDAFLPSPENILEQIELGELRNETNFKYLLQTGYEHVRRVCAAPAS
eukprot:TRINITY_DN640_c0_g1_i11.p1 TRINITY_DN640_c0_g1~~TRINITY_DN640_c0_g1_i11.p1  ORF type:complete len:1128 (-),score=241.91 TRINITY_DN640_c0_g1_i11:253-3636(-)